MEKIASNFVTDDPIASVIKERESTEPDVVGCGSSL
jgi:hypothetical protein